MTHTRKKKFNVKIDTISKTYSCNGIAAYSCNEAVLKACNKYGVMITRIEKVIVKKED